MVGNKKVDTYLSFKNAQDNGMGIPMPSGRVRVSKVDSADGSLEFIGEDRIDHTPKNETVLLKLGSAFDVVGERRQVDFKIDTSRNTMTEEIEVKIRNHKDRGGQGDRQGKPVPLDQLEDRGEHAVLRQAGRAHHPLPDHRAGGQGGDRALYGSLYVVEAVLRLCG